MGSQCFWHWLPDVNENSRLKSSLELFLTRVVSINNSLSLVRGFSLLSGKVRKNFINIIYSPIHPPGDFTS